MTGFSADWLSLREAADARSRNRELASTLSAHFQLRDQIRVVDLGCGTGANLRATASLLPARQHWTLIDNDETLLDACRARLSAWSEAAAVPAGNGALQIVREGRIITVELRKADLAREAEQVVPSAADLVTASALFDITSAAFIRAIAKLAAARRAAFYTVLSYNGVSRWMPRQPADNEMVSAFHQHQMRDKGFGAAAGPTATALLADQFHFHGYRVLEGQSPWKLGQSDAALIAELERGFADAVAETKRVSEKTIEAWRGRRHTACELGHTDTLALPGDASDISLRDEDEDEDED